MSKKTKRVITRLILLIAIIAVVAICGRFERGYWAVAAEPIILATGIFFIWIAEKEWEK